MAFPPIQPGQPVRFTPPRRTKPASKLPVTANYSGAFNSAAEDDRLSKLPPRSITPASAFAGRPKPAPSFPGMKAPASWASSPAMGAAGSVGPAGAPAQRVAVRPSMADGINGRVAAAMPAAESRNGFNMATGAVMPKPAVAVRPGLLPPPESAGSTKAMADGARQQGRMQAQKFNDGMASIKAYNERNAASLATGRSQLGTTSLAGSPTAATGQPMGTMTSSLPSRESQAATGQPMGTTSLAVRPAGGGQSAYMTDPPMAKGGASLPSAQASRVAVQPGRGFSAFMDEQMGDTGWKMSSRGNRGAVATGGKFQGQERTAISSGLRKQFLAMNPEQRAKYDQDAEIMAGTAGRPAGKMKPQPYDESDPMEPEPDMDPDD